MWRDHRHPAIVHWYYTRRGDARTLLALSVFPAHPAFASYSTLPPPPSLPLAALLLRRIAPQFSTSLSVHYAASLVRETTIRSDASLTYRYQGDVSFYSHYCGRILDVIREERNMARTATTNFKFNLLIIVIGCFFSQIFFFLWLDKLISAQLIIICMSEIFKIIIDFFWIVFVYIYFLTICEYRCLLIC